MDVLCIHDTPIQSGDAFNLIDKLMTAYEAEYEIAAIGKKGTKFKPVDWQDWGTRFFDPSAYDRILPMGNVATSAVFNTQKSVLISKTRGRGYMVGNTFTVPTWDPLKIVNGGKEGALLFRDFEYDVDKLLTHDAPEPKPQIDIQICDSVATLETAFEALMCASAIACDTEATGLSFYADRIRDVGLLALDNDNNGFAYIIPEWALAWDFQRNLLLEFMEEYEGAIAFHNIKYDVRMLEKLFGRTFRFKQPWDTMLMHYAQDERPGRGGTHSLKTIARCRYDADDYEIAAHLVYKEIDASVGDVLKVEELYRTLHAYLAKDIYYTARAFFDLHDELKDEDEILLCLVEEILVPGAIALGEIEAYGVGVNTQYLKDMRAKVTQELENELAQLQQFVYDKTGREEFNPNSPKQVETLLYDDLELEVPRGVGRYAYQTRDTDKRSTVADVLKVLSKSIQKDNPAIADLIAQILKYRQRSKMMGTYIDGMLKRVDGDGRIRGDFSVHGSATGRLSCSNPNLQNIPDASHVGLDIREAFVPTEGFELMEADYSQLELRVAALFSQDNQLLDVYRNGGDIHQEVAFKLFGKPREALTKYERYLAKCLNFGIAYGRGPKSIATGPEMDLLYEQSGKRWSMMEVTKHHKQFFKTYKGYARWQDEQKLAVRKRRYVQMPSGRKRRFPFIPRDDKGHTERQAVNTPVQSYASDLCFSALTRIHERIREEIPGDAHVLFTVHDSILLEVRPEKRTQLAQIVMYEMERNLPPYIEYNLPFTAEITVGNHGKEAWGALKNTLDLEEPIRA